MNSEELFDIRMEDFKNYSITKDGKVWSKKTKRFLKQTLCNGYYVVKNSESKTRYVHRLMAITFLDNKNNVNIVNHIDGNPLNNNINNLEWITQKDNINKSTKDTSHKRRVIQFDTEGKIITTHNSISEAGKSVNLTRHAINKVCLNINKTAGGYTWKYEDETFMYNYVNLESAIKIIGYDNYYVFREGLIYNKQRKSFLKPVLNKSGYSYVTLCSSVEGKKNWYVHVIVAKHFIDNNDIKRTQVNHKNKIRNDNRMDNLEWVTPSENMIHSKINDTKFKQ